MLPTGEFNTYKNSVESMVRLLGVPAVWTTARTPTQSANVVVGWRISGRGDQEIINSYGIGTVIATALADQYPIPPEKHDQFQVFPAGVPGEMFNAVAVHPVHLNGVLVFYKIMLKGK